MRSGDLGELSSAVRELRRCGETDLDKLCAELVEIERYLGQFGDSKFSLSELVAGLTVPAWVDC